MRPRLFHSITALALLIVSACDTASFGPSIGHDPRITARAGFEIVTPRALSRGTPVPVVVRAVTAYGGLDVAFDGTVVLLVAPGGAGTAVPIRKGIGSVLLPGPGDGRYVIAGGHRTRAARSVTADEPDSVAAVSGALADAVTVWTPLVVRHLTADTVVPAGHRLEIRAGTRIVLSARANLIVRGTLVVEGSRDDPVYFRPEHADRPWGGIVVEAGRASIEGTFLVGGGGDQSRSYGHSDSQAVVFGEQSDVTIGDSWIMDNVGKGVGARGGTIAVDRTLITRCDMGGEFNYPTVTITDSHILEIPNADGVFADDDNDGLYFWAANPESDPPSLVRNTYLIVGKDDGIDHNDARLVIQNSWLEGFEHEGVAASSGHTVHIENSIIRGNGQGVEAGYGSPAVTVDHSVILDNGTGIRFGDEYGTAATGSIRVSNSIIAGEDVNVLNLDHPSDGPVEGAIELTRSLVDRPIACADCIVAPPVFLPGYFLHPSSPGVRAGTDGFDPGRYRVPSERQRNR